MKDAIAVYDRAWQAKAEMLLPRTVKRRLIIPPGGRKRRRIHQLLTGLAAGSTARMLNQPGKSRKTEKAALLPTAAHPPARFSASTLSWVFSPLPLTP